MAPPCPAAKSLDPAWWGHGPQRTESGGLRVGTQAGPKEAWASKLPTWLTAQKQALVGLGAAPGYHRPREKDWCLDKDWFQELWASESLSATPNVFSAQGVTLPPPLSSGQSTCQSPAH